MAKKQATDSTQHVPASFYMPTTGDQVSRIDAIDHLIEVSCGAARMLSNLAQTEERDDMPTSAMYLIVADALWDAVKQLTHKEPMALGHDL